MATPEILLPFDGQDERYSTDTHTRESTTLKPNHLPAKAAYVLSTSATDPDIKDVLEAFDSIIGDNDVDNRRRLRAQILQELASSNTKVIHDFGLIATKLRDVGDALKVLHETFQDITHRVDTGTLEVTSAIQESDALITQRLKLSDKEVILQAFLEKFTIPVADLANIASSPQSLDDNFFNTLIRVKGIHSDCQILLGSESTRAGVEIMDQMTKNLNSAYQKVYLWLQRELKFLSFETPTGNHRVRRALDVLTNRPALLQSCVDTLAESRQRSLNELFSIALMGGDALNTKPIDVMAHDPIRYVGDMLAWLHSALVGELEALQAIFELSPSSERSDNLSIASVGAILDTELRLRDYVRPLADKSLETALSAFRLRTEHVVSSHEEPNLLYGLLNILIFYLETFKKLVGIETLLVSAIDALISTATRQLQSCLRDLFRSAQQDMPTVTVDLLPPVFLIDALGRFKSLVKNFEASLISDPYKPQSFDMIYSEALKPYIYGCETLSKGLPSPGLHIFMVNCLEVSQNTLRLSTYGTENYSQLLDDAVDRHVVSIIGYLHDHFLEISGLSTLLRMEDDTSQDVSKPSWLTPEILSTCSKELDEFLPTAIIDAESQLFHLSRPSLKKAIIRAALDGFMSDFARIEAALANLPDSSLRDLFPRTTEEIRILLG